MSAGSRISPASFLKHATDVASFYGFAPVCTIEKSFSRTPEKLAGLNIEKSRGVYSFRNTAALGATYAAGRPQEPVLAFYASPNPSYSPFVTHTPAEVGEFGLQVIGSSESVGEIVLLKTLAMIIDEWGSPIARIRINALGDRDSQMRFGRELSAYVRKHAGRLDPSCTHEPLQNPLTMYRCTTSACMEIISEAPRPMHFLSERSRAHFRSVLEHLERLGLRYEIDDQLVGDEKSPHITFAIDLAEDDATIVGAYGGRYDDFLRREAHRKDSVGVGASIFFRKKGAVRSHFAVTPVERKPKIYFAQLGLRAKLQGLGIVDMFREARIPVLQSFDASRLSIQLANAQALGVSHLLIMGQREALDNTVIVRSMQNSSQITMPVGEMPRFLKTLRN